MSEVPVPRAIPRSSGFLMPGAEATCEHQEHMNYNPWVTTLKRKNQAPRKPCVPGHYGDHFLWIDFIPTGIRPHSLQF